MKAVIVGTLLGVVALAVRERLALYRAVRSSPEKLGSLANDHLARVLIERLCLPNRTFIDVGAHIGSVFANVRRESQPDRIIAVEANPEKADALRRKFPDVEVHSCAVADSEGQASFYINDEMSGFSSINQIAASRAEQSSTVNEITVPVRRLDSIVEPDGIDLIKIDVVGAELSVLRGSTKIIAASRPIIVFESIPGTDAETSALWQWFDDNDYAVVVPNRVAHYDDGMSLESFLEGHLYPMRSMNYFGVPRERRDDTRLRARHVLGLEGP